MKKAPLVGPRFDPRDPTRGPNIIVIGGKSGIDFYPNKFW